MSTNLAKRIKQLEEIVRREQSAGCVMADELLIPIAIRRWRSYERRHKKTKIHSLENRVNDLLKAFKELFPDYTYDESCLKHLADSFCLTLGLSVADQSIILDTLSPDGCKVCGDKSLQSFGRIGNWDCKGRRGTIIGSVCLTCHTAYTLNMQGFVFKHLEWTVDGSPKWLV